MDKDVPYIVYESEAARHERTANVLSFLVWSEKSLASVYIDSELCDSKERSETWHHTNRIM